MFFCFQARVRKLWRLAGERVRFIPWRHGGCEEGNLGKSGGFVGQGERVSWDVQIQCLVLMPDSRGFPCCRLE